MVSSAENRAAFISSLATFMETYGFQGVDIDWEYPSEPTRGGRKEDAANFVLLVKEMKTAFQHKLFGISVALAPDYWYLRGFRPGEMQEYVDFFGFMSYDLHGPWDTDVRALGSIVRPQTDVTDIKKDLLPLVYDDVEFSKINLGLAYYGRTYTLADPTCGKIGCGFVPGKGGSSGNCTRSTGILSLSEIRRLVDEEGAKPYLNSTAMVKYFTYAGSSWVGYDDSETLEMKRAFAEENCLGGMMIWSIDFDPETGGGEGPNENVSPESATVIPMAYTTVPRGSTFTLGLGAATDLPALPHDGNQNTPKGPGEAKCSSCSFFRLITSTCCGTGGSLGNPILISPGLPLPMDIPLPSGFIPNQPFIDRDGNSVPSGVPLPKETVIPRGTSFPSPFTIPAGQPFREGEGDDTVNNSTTIWISPNIWDSDHPQLKCFPPCTFVLPPWPNISTTLEYPRITWVDDDKKTKTTITFPIITKSSWPVETVVVDDDDPKNTKRLRTSTPVPRTTTWPPRTWSDHNGRKHTTTPTLPGPIPPPATMSLPLITIAVGAPFPLPSGCRFPVRQERGTIQTTLGIAKRETTLIRMKETTLKTMKETKSRYRRRMKATEKMRGTTYASLRIHPLTESQMTNTTQTTPSSAAQALQAATRAPGRPVAKEARRGRPPPQPPSSLPRLENGKPQISPRALDAVSTAGNGATADVSSKRLSTSAAISKTEQYILGTASRKPRTSTRRLRTGRLPT